MAGAVSKSTDEADDIDRVVDEIVAEGGENAAAFRIATDTAKAALKAAEGVMSCLNHSADLKMASSMMVVTSIVFSMAFAIGKDGEPQNSDDYARRDFFGMVGHIMASAVDVGLVDDRFLGATSKFTPSTAH